MRNVARIVCLVGAAVVATSAAAQTGTTDKPNPPTKKTTTPPMMMPVGAPAPTPKSVKDGQEQRKPAPQLDPQKVR